MSEFDCEVYIARLSKLESEFAAMQAKVSFFSVIYDKFDKTLDKLEVALEDRRESTNEEIKETHRKIDNLQKDLMDQLAELRKEMTRQHENEKRRIEDINKWRWFMMGGAVVISWIVSVAVNAFKAIPQ